MNTEQIRRVTYTFDSVDDFVEYLTNMAKRLRSSADTAATKKANESLKAQAFTVEQIRDTVADSNLTVNND